MRIEIRVPDIRGMQSRDRAADTLRQNRPERSLREPISQGLRTLDPACKQVCTITQTIVHIPRGDW